MYAYMHNYVFAYPCLHMYDIRSYVCMYVYVFLHVVIYMSSTMCMHIGTSYFAMKTHALKDAQFFTTNNVMFVATVVKCCDASNSAVIVK